ncbi:hypothetical protein ASE07_23680 [Noviherbaspirillum sp. Root189]|nr:hypothetical protein ASE07_23680 [Noviherbaspirillum sp. Root189]
MSYCPFFQTLYDETRPVGNLGRGTHYSVLRVPTWHDEFLVPLQRGAFLDFAIIWDEDHDERLIDAIQILYLGGLLAPVRYIGERKGSLVVLLDPDVVQAWNGSALNEYRDKVDDVAQSLEDPWTVTVESADGDQHSIINSSPEKVSIYLKNIDVLWQLGVKPKTKTELPPAFGTQH